METYYGSSILNRFKADLVVNATKTTVTVEKDGIQYNPGRTLPMGTYTITAVAQGTATFESLTVNGEPFTSGDTIDVSFGDTLNIVAVSTGGHTPPTPDTDLRNTKWTFLIDDITPAPVSGNTSVNNVLFTLSFRYSSGDVVLGSLTEGQEIYLQTGITRLPRSTPQLRLYKTGSNSPTYYYSGGSTTLPKREITATIIFPDSEFNSTDSNLLAFVHSNFTYVGPAEE